MELGIINSKGEEIYRTDYATEDATISLEIPDVHESLKTNAIVKNYQKPNKQELSI